MKRSDQCLALKNLPDSYLDNRMLSGGIGRFCLAAAVVLVMLLATSFGQTHAFTSVVAISPSDVWAVGNTTTPSGQGIVAAALAEHWNGTKWTVISTPDPGGRC